MRRSRAVLALLGERCRTGERPYVHVARAAVVAKQDVDGRVVRAPYLTEWRDGFGRCGTTRALSDRDVELAAVCGRAVASHWREPRACNPAAARRGRRDTSACHGVLVPRAHRAPLQVRAPLVTSATTTSSRTRDPTRTPNCCHEPRGSGARLLDSATRGAHAVASEGRVDGTPV